MDAIIYGMSAANILDTQMVVGLTYATGIVICLIGMLVSSLTKKPGA